MKTPHLSVVIPAFNEEVIIKKNLKEVLLYLSKKKYSSEVLVVDDGSGDKTESIVGKIMSVKLVRHGHNLGKGAAVRTGMLSAAGKFVVFMDADLSVPLNYLDDIVEALDKFDVAIASRRVRGAVIKKHQPFIRETMGRVFTKITQVVMASDVADFTCGLKGFRREAARKVFGKSIINRWAYDSEIIFLAQKFGFSIKQVPIVWINRQDSRVRVGRAAAESLLDLVKIRVFDILGKYEN